MDDNQKKLLQRLAYCIERGKDRVDSPYPKDMLGEEGAWELCREALQLSVSPNVILQDALVKGMRTIGEKFASGAAFIPELLIAAKAMKTAMEHLEPFFRSGKAEHLGTVVLGTVSGDLHDIGKNIVKLVLEGEGWKVIDLGVNIAPEKFSYAVKEHPKSIVGISALLTTTMENMAAAVSKLKESAATVPVYVGGAPITQKFAKSIGADGYFPDPYSFAKHIAMYA